MAIAEEIEVFILGMHTRFDPAIVIEDQCFGIIMNRTAFGRH